MKLTIIFLFLLLCFTASGQYTITQQVRKNLFSRESTDKYLLVTQVIKPCDCLFETYLYSEVELNTLEYLESIKCAEYEKAEKWIANMLYLEQKAAEEKVRIQQVNDIKCK